MGISNFKSIWQVFIGILAFNEQRIEVKLTLAGKLNSIIITKS